MPSLFSIANNYDGSDDGSWFKTVNGGNRTVNGAESVQRVQEVQEVQEVQTGS
jgi:hypothetical protein